MKSRTIKFAWVNGYFLDLMEKAILIMFLILFIARMIAGRALISNPVNILIVLSEILILSFILFRRRTDNISSSFGDWFFGLSGMVLPLLGRPAEGMPIAPMEICLILLLMGLFFEITAKLTLRKSFGVIAADRGVKIGGPYVFVRHPMYLGYLLTYTGFLLGGPTLWNFVVYSSTAVIFLVRIAAEERLLMHNPDYRRFAERVRNRLVPYVF